MTSEDERPVRGFLPPHAPGASAPRRWDVEDPEAAAGPPPAPIAAVPVQPPQPSQPPAAAGWAPPTAAPRYAPASGAPRNPGAVASLVLGIVSVGAVVLTVGVFAVLTLPTAIAAWVMGRRAVRAADREGLGQRSQAQAGFVLGIVGVVLSVLAIVVWIALLSDDAFVRELERELDRQRGS
jgi:hypothetical protein